MLGLSLVFVASWWLTGMKVRSLQSRAVECMVICQGSRRCKAMIREARESLLVLGEALLGRGNGLMCQPGLRPIDTTNLGLE